MKEDICLLFMPQCMPYDPYPALPYLTGYLRSKDIQVAQYDVNRDYYDFILQKEVLNEVYKEVEEEFNYLDKKDVLTKKEAAKYRNFVKPVLFAENTIQTIDEAMEVMCNKDLFYDSSKYLWASNTISSALALYSSKFYPERVTLSSYHFYSDDTISIQSVIELVESNRKSIFDEYLDHVLLPYIDKTKPPIIGFSMFDFSQFYVSLLFVKMIKRIESYHPIIVFGGILISFYREKLSKNEKIFDYIDAAIIYEGEEPLYQYLRYVKGEIGIESVGNLIYRSEKNKVIENHILNFEINNIAIPDYNGIAMNNYFSPEQIVSVLSSKGCSWGRCTFCTQHLISGRGVYVERDIDKFIADIRVLKGIYKTKYFWFNDTSIKANRLEEISDHLIQSGIDISWRCETRFESGLTDDIIKKAAKAGCKKIGFGMESASHKILKKIKKGINLDDVKRIIKTCFNNGIAPQVYYIIGFPTEQIEDVNETLKFVEENRRFMGTFGFSELFLEEQSEMQLNPEKNGIKNMVLIDELRRAYQFDNDGISNDEAAAIVRETVSKYSKEIGERPFWGDEVESHHLFYLDYYNEPSLESAKIKKRHLKLSETSKFISNSRIKKLNFNINALLDQENVMQNNSYILIIDNEFLVFEVQELLVQILHLCQEPIDSIHLFESLNRLNYKIEKEAVKNLVYNLLRKGAIKAINE